jgi:preprotein translocase subunit SecG
MVAFLIVLHTLVCLFLILSVLLQPGARGGMGAAFGGAGGATVFGGRGANTFLAKLTGSAAVVFMLTSISLSFFGSSSSSVMDKMGGGKPAAGATTTTTATDADEPVDEPAPAADGPAAAADEPADEPAGDDADDETP